MNMLRIKTDWCIPNLKILGILALVFPQMASAHLYRNQVCHGYKESAATIVMKPLAKYTYLEPTISKPADFISYLSRHPKFAEDFMRCLAKAVDRFPVLQNGFTIAFQNARHEAPKSSFAVLLKSPLFYVGTKYEFAVDKKQRIQLKQRYESFHAYRHILSGKADELSPKIALSGPYRKHRIDIQRSTRSIAFRERDGDIVVIPKGPYVSMYDFAKKASVKEHCDFWGVLSKQLDDLEDKHQPYRLHFASGTAAGQRVPHASVRIEIIR